MHNPLLLLYRLLLLLSILLAGPYHNTISALPNLSQKNGLSSNSIISVEKDKEGYLWFASKSGIDRYDGTDVVSYDDINGNVIIDKSGNLFSYNPKGEIYRYDETAGSFSKYVSLSPEIVNAICFNDDNEMFAGTRSGLFRIEYDAGMGHAVKILDLKNIFCLEQGPGNTIFAGTQNCLVAVDSVGHVDTLLKNSFVQSLMYDRKHRELWVGTYSSGSYRYDFRSDRLDSISCVPKRYPVRTFESDGTSIWIGTDGNGVYIIDQETLELKEHYNTYSPDHSKRLTANGVYKLFKDGDLMWICTYTGGVDIYDSNKIEAESFSLFDNDGKTQLGDVCVNTILEDSDGNIWFGTNNGISVYSPASGRWQYFLKSAGKSSRLECNVIMCLYEDGEYMWAGGYTVGAFRINRKTGEITHYTTVTSGIGTNYVFDIAGDEKGNIWFSGIHGPLSVMNPETNSFEYYHIYNGQVIEVIPDNRLLIGTMEGLILLYTDSRAIETIVFSEDDNKYNRIYSIDYIDENCLYVSTEAGVMKYNLDQRKIESRFNQDNPTFSVLEDGLKRLWISSASGIVCVDPETGRNNLLPLTDILTVNPFNKNSYCKLSNGKFVFGGANGAVIVNPSWHSPAQKEYPFRFTKFAVAGTKSSYKEYLHVKDYNQPKQEKSKIVLKYYQNSVDISFALLDYNLMDDIRYSWKIDGLTDSWSELTSDNRINLLYLSPGTYRIELRAYVNSVLNAETFISFKIRPPFFKSSYFFCILILLCITFFIMLFRMKKNKMEVQVSDEKIKFFVNVAHEIRTPVSLIKSPIQDVIRNERLSDEGQKSLSIALNNSEKLLFVVNQLMDFQNSERLTARLCVEEIDIVSYLNEKVKEFRLWSNEKQQELNLHSPDKSRTVWIDVSKMDIIIQNLLSNAIKYTGEKGVIDLSLVFNSSSFCITVSDNGIGIPVKERKKIFSRFYRAENAVNLKTSGSGLGLLLVKNYSILMGGDVSYRPGDYGGSEFTVRLPLGKSHYLPEQIMMPGAGTIKKADSFTPLQASQKHEVEKNPKYRKADILIVDDNDELLQYLKNSLSSKYYRVTSISDGAAVMDEIHKNIPDLIITDVLMPNLNGDALCRRIKADPETSHIPVIMLTAMSEVENVVEGLESGADVYLTKPFDMQVLKAYIHNLIYSRHTIVNKLSGIHNNGTAKDLVFDGPESPGSIVKDCHENDTQFYEVVLSLIKKNISNSEYTIQNICEEMAMSRSVFYKRIKAITGKSPNDLLREIRLKYAAQLLKTKRYTIVEVAAKTGFPDQRYFSTVFKRYFGQTPSSYIRNE